MARRLKEAAMFPLPHFTAAVVAVLLYEVHGWIIAAAYVVFAAYAISTRGRFLFVGAIAAALLTPLLAPILFGWKI